MIFAKTTSSANFNPRSLHGERPRLHFPRIRRAYFNPRSLHGERRPKQAPYKARRDFNPRSLHGERPRGRIFKRFPRKISIHAPCTGSDECNFNRRESRCDFNPRSLHGERRESMPLMAQHPQVFQSTLPARGATEGGGKKWWDALISIHAPCTGSDQVAQPQRAQGGISIHAPCTGSDLQTCALVERCI